MLDFFQAASTAPHEFAWLTHVDGEPAGGNVHAINTVSLPPGAPWSYLRMPSSASSTGQVWECFSDGPRTLRVDVLADGPVDVVHCGFPHDDSPGSPTIPMRIFGRQGNATWFLAVYRLGAKPGPAELKVAPAGTAGMTVTLRLDEKVVQHTVPRL